MPDGSNLVIGTINTGTATTELQRSGGATATALSVDNSAGTAVAASSRFNIGVSGLSESDVGVIGNSKSSPGVKGQSVDDAGVFGISSWRVGVVGVSPQTVGVNGVTEADNSAGVSGLVSTDSAGVWGQVRGGHGTWPGVEGFSSTGHGVRGVSIASGPGSNVGVVGFSTAGNGIVGIAGSPSTSAFGVVSLGGLLNVGGPKSSAVPHPDGSHRLLYCIESPESWFEDFGRATLVRGRSIVKLDPGFAAVVRTENYHVFLCPEGDVKGLHVSRRNRAGFEVREHEAGKSSTTFSYRVVARRKDIKAQRLRKVVLPRFDNKALEKIPKAIEKLAKGGKGGKKTHRDVRRLPGGRP